MLKVTQLSGHEVLSVLPDGWLLPALFLAFCAQVCASASSQVPCSPGFPPPRPSLSALPLSGFPPAPPICFSFGLSAPVSPFLCLPCAPTLLSQSHLLWGHPQDSGHSEVPGDSRSPAVPLCPSALGLRQEGWAKGRGRRPQQPKL